MASSPNPSAQFPGRNDFYSCCATLPIAVEHSRQRQWSDSGILSDLISWPPLKRLQAAILLGGRGAESLGPRQPTNAGHLDPSDLPHEPDVNEHPSGTAGDGARPLQDDRGRLALIAGPRAILGSPPHRKKTIFATGRPEQNLSDSRIASRKCAARRPLRASQADEVGVKLDMTREEPEPTVATNPPWS